MSTKPTSTSTTEEAAFMRVSTNNQKNKKTRQRRKQGQRKQQAQTSYDTTANIKTVINPPTAAVDVTQSSANTQPAIITIRKESQKPTFAAVISNLTDSVTDADITITTITTTTNETPATIITNSTSTPVASKHSPYECLTILRRLWSALVVRRVYNVIPGVRLDDTYIKSINPNTVWGGSFTTHKIQVEEREYEAIPHIEYPRFRWYSGFTDKKHSRECAYQILRPELYNQAIYFNSAKSHYKQFDMTQYKNAWFRDIDMKDTLVEEAVCTAPERGDFIIGTVEMGEKGWFFDRWFIASPEFVRFFNLVMDKEINQTPIDWTMASMLDGTWHDAWRGAHVKYFDGVNSVVTRMFDLKTKLSWMQTSSHLFDQITVPPYTRHLYYYYQLLATGEIMHFVDETSFSVDLVKYHYSELITHAELELSIEEGREYEMSITKTSTTTVT